MLGNRLHRHPKGSVRQTADRKRASGLGGPNSVLALQRMAGNHAVGMLAREAKEPPPESIASADEALREAKGVAKDLDEEVRGQRHIDTHKRNRDTRKIKAKLRRIANAPAGAPVTEAQRQAATELLGQIEDADNELRALEIERARARGQATRDRRAKDWESRSGTVEKGGGQKSPVQSGQTVRGEVQVKKEKGGPTTTSGPKVVVDDPALSPDPGGTSAKKGGGGGAGGSTSTSSKATKVETTVAKEAGEATVAKPKLYTRLGPRVGKATLALIDGLMPDPTDVIAMMIEYAESFKAAQEAVRLRNVEKGFAIGWACYVLFPTWERAQTFARTYVEKDVITQIIDAVGIAENAYNEGLVRGFRYGEKHTTAQLDNVRQRALDAVHRSGQTVNGSYLGDGVYQFVRDDVYLFAGALMKATREVLADSERRKELREEVERLERNREQIERDYEIDMARK